MSALEVDVDALAAAVAVRVAALLDERQGQVAQRPGLVDAQALAAELGVARRWVYDHCDELGAIRLGGGPKAPLRFDLEAAKAAMRCSVSKRSQGTNASDGGTSAPARARRSRRLPNGLPKPGSVLAVRGREGS